jgi:hypothetical protein
VKNYEERERHLWFEAGLRLTPFTLVIPTNKIDYTI